MGFVQTAIAVQSIGTCLVAFFLWQLGRAIQVRFVTSWALATITFGVALGFLHLVVEIGDFSWSARAAFGVYLTGSYIMAFLLWSGLREHARDQPFQLRHLARFAPLLAFAAAGPWLATGFRDLVPAHFLILGVLFVAMIADMRSPAPSRSIGRPIVRGSLALLALLMLWHAVMAWLRGDGADWSHRSFGLIVAIDALAELLIVFGIVILACERVRDQLEANNKELRDAKAELETVARTDGLTGLLNRRAFEEWMAAPPGEPRDGCLAAIDLNDLKHLNDTHLHAAGDAALKIVARALQNRFRVTDPIFRVGGDEFAVAMPGGDPDELARRLAAIDEELENRRLPGIDQPIALRIAWGVAAYSADCPADRAFSIADRAMYAQKGRRKATPPATR